MTKCAHDLCIRNAVEGSKYCDQCIQLSTKECNYCELMIITENRILADEIQFEINRRNKRVVYLVIACVSLSLVALFCLWVWQS